MWRVLFPFALLCAFAAFGCNGNAGTSGSEPDSGVVYVPTDDPEMARAIAEAQRTVNDFIGHLKDPQAGMGMFAVKKKYPTPSGSAEHIWIEVTEFREGRFYGTIADHPVHIEGISLGSPASVGKSEITDWMIATESGFLGGFTIAVLDKQAGAK